jgi:hydrogenase small subunit
LQAAKPNPTNAKSVKDLIEGKPVINVSGCPPISEVMAAVVAHYLVFGKIPKLDDKGRPGTFYDKVLHDTCYRRAYYESGQFAASFDDQNGYCLFNLGCKGPVTNTACGIIGHSGGVSFPVKSGHPCIGCTEPNFWDEMTPFYKTL